MRTKTWNQFHRTLQLLPEGHDAHTTWQAVLDKKARNLRAQFIASWKEDPSWNFVKIFKKESMHEEDTQTLEFDWLTAKQMVDRYGKKAKQVMKLKRQKDEFKIDPDDGCNKYRVKVKESDRHVVGSRKDKILELSADSGVVSVLPPRTTALLALPSPLPVEDDPPDPTEDCATQAAPMNFLAKKERKVAKKALGDDVFNAIATLRSKVQITALWEPATSLPTCHGRDILNGGHLSTIMLSYRFPCSNTHHGRLTGGRTSD